MDIMIMIILGIVGGVMIATVAVCGIYYSYRTKKDQEKEKTAKKVPPSAPARRSVRTESEPYVVYQDESLVDFDSIPVQPETKRPIRYLFLLFSFAKATVHIQWRSIVMVVQFRVILLPLDAFTILVSRSPDDVYPPLREEEQDDYLLSNLDMDISPTSVIPPVGHVITIYKEHIKGSFLISLGRLLFSDRLQGFLDYRENTLF